MSDTESEFLDTDPNKLTIPQLKSKLNQLGVDLPMRTERKQFYVDLFTSKQEEKRKVSLVTSSLLNLKEIEKSKRKREAAEEAKEKTTPKKAKKTDDDDEESSSGNSSFTIQLTQISQKEPQKKTIKPIPRRSRQRCRRRR